MGEYFSNQQLWVKCRVISCSISHGWPEMSSPAHRERGKQVRSCLVVKGLFVPHSIHGLVLGGPKQSFPSFSSRMVFSGRQEAGINYLASDDGFFLICFFRNAPYSISAGRDCGIQVQTNICTKGTEEFLDLPFACVNFASQLHQKATEASLCM